MLRADTPDVRDPLRNKPAVRQRQVRLRLETWAVSLTGLGALAGLIYVTVQYGTW